MMNIFRFLKWNLHKINRITLAIIIVCFSIPIGIYFVGVLYFIVLSSIIGFGMLSCIFYEIIQKQWYEFLRFQEEEEQKIINKLKGIE